MIFLEFYHEESCTVVHLPLICGHPASNMRRTFMLPFSTARELGKLGPIDSYGDNLCTISLELSEYRYGFSI